MSLNTLQVLCLDTYSYQRYLSITHPDSPLLLYGSPLLRRSRTPGKKSSYTTQYTFSLHPVFRLCIYSLDWRLFAFHHLGIFGTNRSFLSMNVSKEGDR